MEKHRNYFFIIFLSVGIILVTGLTTLGSSFKLNKEVPVTSDFSLQAAPEKPVEDEVKDYLSPDGKYTLTMKNGGVKEGKVRQRFYIKADGSDTSSLILDKESPTGKLIDVPFNTFAPNDKYVFLISKNTDDVQYIVLKTDGKEIKPGSLSVEITELFKEKHPDFVITDVTGWGGNNLIVINTDTSDGKTGPSWWFELPATGFIRLSTRFN